MDNKGTYELGWSDILLIKGNQGCCCIMWQEVGWVEVNGPLGDRILLFHSEVKVKGPLLQPYRDRITKVSDFSGRKT